MVILLRVGYNKVYSKKWLYFYELITIRFIVKNGYTFTSWLQLGL